MSATKVKLVCDDPQLRQSLAKQIANLTADEEMYWRFAYNCHTVMRVAGITSRDLAATLGVHRTSLSALTSVGSRPPYLTLMIAFVQHLKIRNYERLFGPHLSLAQARQLIGRRSSS